MCFSLQASIIAATSLIALGSIGVKQKYKTTTRLIAAIPFIFGLQQASEAIIWAQVPFKLSTTTVNTAAYTFLFFAYFVWPIWVPIALCHAEPNKTRKKIMIIPLLCGIFVGCILLYFLITTHIKSAISYSHIVYTVGIPTTWYTPSTLLYLAATVVPWLVSSLGGMWIIGILLTISYAASIWFYFATLTSVWCFFAAILSAMILVILKKNHT